MGAPGAYTVDAIHQRIIRITLDLDDDVVAAARELAAGERRSLGAVVSDLARRGLTLPRVDAVDGLPVVRVPAGTPPITPEMVQRALDEDWRRRSRSSRSGTARPAAAPGAV